MEEVSVFVPGHISGFFQAIDEFDDSLRMGSRNCGPCISAGVLTEVEVKESDVNELEVFLNGEMAAAETTKAAVGEVLEMNEEPVSVSVRHSVQAPAGSGYGMSGAGALGAALALSEALKIDFTREEVLALAHRAEVTCGSGLGDVGPQMLGGLVIGVEPGAPPYGKWEKIEVRQDMKVICGTLGPLPTSEFLADPENRKRSEELGKIALQELLSNRSAENFMEVSEEFSLALGIFDEEFKEIIKNISSESPLGASAVMLGRAVFALGPASKIEYLKRIFSDYFDLESIMIASVDFEGARVLS